MFRLGEYFSGPGGLAWGAIHAGDDCESNIETIEHIWAFDIDKAACETYEKNITKNRPESGVFCRDIRTVSEEEIIQLPQIDAFAFGFPCNDFSLVGKQKGLDGEYGPLYSYGVKVLRIKKPRWFLAENVSGLRSSGQGRALEKILCDMADAGYRLYPHLYKFEEYGVPQTRHRVIIIGIRKDEKVVFRPPAPTRKSPQEYKTVREALEKPLEGLSNNELTKQSERVIHRLQYIKPGENAFTANLPRELRLNVNGATLSQIYRRLEPDKPAYTVTGSGGGGTHIYHYSENRALTNRERARLQSFSDDFIFCGKKDEVRKQIGMAVPPDGAKIIFQAILKSFAGIEYPAVAPNIKFDNDSRLLLQGRSLK